ncbi:zinc metalloprotease HtpX [endosymbiont of Ridgeia piscesae]|jgi:heat shock protein HtpX|uniref:Zn-dependent protease with chaperone function n=2 Tax=endosymbiont of Ridgeia piscesae TaxID=54398 RepID=A0A0T5YSU0_9GAMM|nr:zinc metalloprotease HtpX [endosymbiont of Ridgeia piscesae]KRT53623.1 Zn-dependent protease with chaperone function [endosymbiont of Ridgeia piscesae]
MAIDSQIWHQHALANRIQSLLLLVAMVSFLSLLGWVLWGVDGIFWLLLLGFVLLLFNPVASPWLIMRMYRATRLTSVKAPTLDSTLRELAHRAGLHRVPELFYVPSPMVNAFTVGSRNEAVIAVTDGLLRSLDTRETVGVLAHEVSHVRNNDMWVMGMADLFSRLTSLLSLLGQFLLLLNLPLIVMSNVSINWFAILLLIFAPNLSALAQLGLSRTREYEADLSAARLTGDPEGLANALVKIEQRSGSLLERLFLPGRRIPEPSLLRTHPPTKERVRRLMALKPPVVEPLSFIRRERGFLQDDAPVYLVSRRP